MTEQRKGRAFGERIPATSPYLTILGSYWKRPEFCPTFQDAKAALEAHPVSQSPYMHLEVHHVTEIGNTLFRITGL